MPTFPSAAATFLPSAVSTSIRCAPTAATFPITLWSCPSCARAMPATARSDATRTAVVFVCVDSSVPVRA